MRNIGRTREAMQEDHRKQNTKEAIESAIFSVVWKCAMAYCIVKFLEELWK